MTIAPIPTMIKTMNANAKTDGSALRAYKPISPINNHLALNNAKPAIKPTPGTKLITLTANLNRSMVPSPKTASNGSAR